MPIPLLSEDRKATVAEFVVQGATLIIEDLPDDRPASRPVAGPASRPVAGPDFVLLHGLGMGRSVFVDLVRHLPGRIIAIDLPGFGEAPEPARTPTMERHADLVAAFLRHAGIDGVIPIGHSMGSQVAAELAARHPGLVSGVVLAAPTVDRHARSIARQALRMGRDILRFDPRVFLRGSREYLRAGPHIARKVRATVVHRPELAYPRIVAPALVLRGSADPVCPADWCRSVADTIPDARLATVTGHGHETMISDAAPAASLIAEFAAAHVRGRPTG
ncbi:pimeloyl-ACP methyl ester carboxylesterase [Microbacterium resistens]|uniref:Pimeloyl-ACP methyl ester carboxylesterase n=1 Tax=Microbacterium resistens TaxID=156977 RepID=A0ABU1SBJ1_9MICO|nr:alpha/beta fold hydrolase [Microbacterium resistens]MDR6866975.1 pimeloyl-ACP methyl ester carboxylesterase [Microbacterium resistens]